MATSLVSNSELLQKLSVVSCPRMLSMGLQSQSPVRVTVSHALDKQINSNESDLLWVNNRFNEHSEVVQLKGLKQCACNRNFA